MEKWVQLKPEILFQKPTDFKIKIIFLKSTVTATFINDIVKLDI